MKWEVLKRFFCLIGFMIIARGAEAVLERKNGFLIKRRVSKGYRIKELDFRIRRSCTRKEVKLLERGSCFIRVPKVFEYSDEKMWIKMEFVKGVLLRDVLDNFNFLKRREICELIGESIAKLHLNNIIHGDLTSSNIILRGNDLVFIDFGLGFFSRKVEDKAVDLYLLKRAFESKHYRCFEECFDSVLVGYKKVDKDLFFDVVSRLRQVEKRGRYKRKKQ